MPTNSTNLPTLQTYLQAHQGDFKTLYYPGAGTDFSPFYLFSLVGGTQQTYYADYSPEMNPRIQQLAAHGFMEVGRDGIEVLWPQVCNNVHEIIGFGAKQAHDFNQPNWGGFWHNQEPIDQGHSVQWDEATGAFMKLRFPGGIRYDLLGEIGIPANQWDFMYHTPIGNGLWNYLAHHLGLNTENIEQTLLHRGIQIKEDNGYYIVLPDGVKFEDPVRLLSYIKIRLNDFTNSDHSTMVYLGTDGFGTASVLLANAIKPDVVVLQDHGYGHTYNIFGLGQDGSSLLYDQFGDNLPEYLFVDTSITTPWPGYEPVTLPFNPTSEIIPGFTLPTAIRPQHGNERVLYKRTR